MTLNRTTLMIGLLLSVYASVAPPVERALTLAWFSELSPEHSYWKQNFAFASAAAEDLGVTLVPFYVESDQIWYRNLVSQLNTSDSKDGMDGLIFLNIKQQNAALLDAVEKNGLPAISNVLSTDYDKVGLPRERYDSWIAEIVDDEEDNGYQLALRLFDEARRLGLYAPDGTIHLVAIHGKVSDSAAIKRAQGLERALAELSDITYHQGFSATNWSRAEGADFTSVALRRYPHTAVIWATNDDTLLGVLKAAQDAGKAPGKDFVTGSIDGTLDVIQKVAAGEVVCTIGGLSLHSGWAVVLLHDYLSGRDFVSDTGVLVKNSNMVIDRSNASRFLDRFGDGDWSRVDFKRYSKMHSPELEHYDFSIEPLLENR